MARIKPDVETSPTRGTKSHLRGIDRQPAKAGCMGEKDAERQAWVTTLCVVTKDMEDRYGKYNTYAEFNRI